MPASCLLGLSVAWSGRSGADWLRTGHQDQPDVQTQPTYSRSLGFIRRWVGPSVFTFALIPGPFMITSLWAGAVHYPLWRFLLFVTAGKMIKLTGFAFVGYYSIPWLFRPLG